MREGILKHCSAANARKLGELGERFLQRRQPSLEAQLANLADEIAYNNHDVDDGLRAGLITIDDLRELAIFRRQFDVVAERYPQLGGAAPGARSRAPHDRLHRERPDRRVEPAPSPRQRRRTSRPCGHGPSRCCGSATKRATEHLELKRYLRDHLYRHYRVLRMTNKARKVVRDLFETMLEDTDLMPTEHQAAARRMEAEDGRTGRARAVADYIAGMTDRYAILEHRRLFNPAERT